MLSFTIKKAERTETEATRNIIGHVGGSSGVYTMFFGREFIFVCSRNFS
jgi:hypothetical protein